MVILFFGASIFIHELGHYLAARWRGLKIERFSIGFGPRLFGWKDKQGVDWRISLFPLGGYVALPQLADMRGVEGEYEEQEPLAVLSYADKMIVSVAGAFFNILFALALASVLWVTGLPVLDELETTRIGYLAETVTDEDGNQREGPALAAGLRPGDRIVEIDGNRVKNWEDVMHDVITGVRRTESGNPKTDLLIERDGEQLEITVFPILEEHEKIRQLGMTYATSLQIDSVMENSPAQLGGLQSGDQILEVNGEPVYHRSVLGMEIRDNPDQELLLTVLRGDERIQAVVLPEQVVYNTAGETTPMIGVRWLREIHTRHINPVDQVVRAIDTTLNVLAALVNPKSNVGINNLSGPIGIGYAIYLTSLFSFFEVLSLIVLINVNLAILNLLPIPVLDGGHMAFATVARLMNKPIPARIIATSQATFMLLFLAIAVYVTVFDFGRVFRNESAITDQEEVAKERVEIQFSGNRETAQPTP